MDENTVLDILSTFLGDYKKSSSGNWAFKCINPNCDSRKNNKYKLGIKLTDRGHYHCWVCDFRGNSIVWLASKYGSKDAVDKLRATGSFGRLEKYKSESTVVSLPPEFIPLTGVNSNAVTYPYLKYLNSRGIDCFSIERYNLGYCSEGQYADRLVMPSYDCDGILNYFMTRLIIPIKNVYRGATVNKKSIIIMEQYLNFNYPIIITEGMFDAMKLYYNVSPLCGSELSSEHLLFQKIVEHNTPVILALDNDKTGISHAASIAELFQSYNINTSMAMPPFKTKDFGKLSVQASLEIVKNASKLDYETIIKMKMGQHFG